MVEPKKSLNQEFMDFLNKYGIIGLGIGLGIAFFIGVAFSKLMAAFFTDLIMPIIGALLPSGDWRTATFIIGNIKFMIGDFVGALIDFIIIAIVIFLIVKAIVKEKK